MTITTTTTEELYTGDATTTAFAINYQFYNTTEILVLVDGVEKTGGGADYTITGGAGLIGTCTFVAAPALSTTIVIRRETLLTQQADIAAATKIPTAAVETSLDRRALGDQESFTTGPSAHRQVASAATLNLLPTDKVLSITGGTDITHLLGAVKGHELSIIWDDSASFGLDNQVGGYGEFNIGADLNPVGTGRKVSLAFDGLAWAGPEISASNVVIGELFDELQIGDDIVGFTTNTDIDQLRIFGTANVGMTIGGSTTSKGGFAFGDPDDEDKWHLEYDHATDIMDIKIGGTSYLQIDEPNGTMDLSIAGTSFLLMDLPNDTATATVQEFHIVSNGGSGQTSGTSADHFVIDSGDTNVGMSILTGSNSGLVQIMMGSPSTPQDGRIQYNKASPNRMGFHVNGSASDEVGIEPNVLNLSTGTVMSINSVQVVGPRDTGWTPPTGTATKLNAGWDTATGTNQELGEMLLAIYEALAGHGLIGT